MSDDPTLDPDIRDDLEQWLGGLEGRSLDVWREMMEQLRHTSEDMWRSTRFFLAVNGVFLTGLFLLSRDQLPLDTMSPSTIRAVLWVSVAGLAFAILGMFTLYRQRRYYSGVMVRKTLVEEVLGLSHETSHPEDKSISMSIPWSIHSFPKEETGKDLLEDVFEDPPRFERRFMWKGWVTNAHFLAYILLILLYAIVASQATLQL